MYFSASCMTRRSPVFPVTSPNVPLVGLALAPPQLGWFSTLNTSQRIRSRCCSVTGKFFRRPRSQDQKLGLYSMFFGWVLAKVPVAGRVKAALLNHTADSVNGVRSMSGSPVRLQNWVPLPPPTPAMSFPSRTENGPPDWYWLMPESSQLPSSRFIHPDCPRRNGSS